MQNIPTTPVTSIFTFTQFLQDLDTVNKNPKNLCFDQNLTMRESTTSAPQADLKTVVSKTHTLITSLINTFQVQQATFPTWMLFFHRFDKYMERHPEGTSNPALARKCRSTNNSDRKSIGIAFHKENMARFLVMELAECICQINANSNNLCLTTHLTVQDKATTPSRHQISIQDFLEFVNATLESIITNSCVHVVSYQAWSLFLHVLDTYIERARQSSSNETLATQAFIAYENAKDKLQENLDTSCITKSTDIIHTKKSERLTSKDMLHLHTALDHIAGAFQIVHLHLLQYMLELAHYFQACELEKIIGEFEEVKTSVDPMRVRFDKAKLQLDSEAFALCMELESFNRHNNKTSEVKDVKRSQNQGRTALENYMLPRVQEKPSLSAPAQKLLDAWIYSSLLLDGHASSISIETSSHLFNAQNKKEMEILQEIEEIADFYHSQQSFIKTIRLLNQMKSTQRSEQYEQIKQEIKANFAKLDHFIKLKAFYSSFYHQVYTRYNQEIATNPGIVKDIRSLTKTPINEGRILTPEELQALIADNLSFERCLDHITELHKDINKLGSESEVFILQSCMSFLMDPDNHGRTSITHPFLTHRIKKHFATYCSPFLDRNKRYLEQEADVLELCKQQRLGDVAPRTEASTKEIEQSYLPIDLQKQGALKKKQKPHVNKSSGAKKQQSSKAKKTATRAHSHSKQGAKKAAKPSQPLAKKPPQAPITDLSEEFRALSLANSQPKAKTPSARTAVQPAHAMQNTSKKAQKTTRQPHQPSPSPTKTHTCQQVEQLADHFQQLTISQHAPSKNASPRKFKPIPIQTELLPPVQNTHAMTQPHPAYLSYSAAVTAKTTSADSEEKEKEKETVPTASMPSLTSITQLPLSQTNIVSRIANMHCRLEAENRVHDWYSLKAGERIKGYEDLPEDKFYAKKIFHTYPTYITRIAISKGIYSKYYSTKNRCHNPSFTIAGEITYHNGRELVTIQGVFEDTACQVELTKRNVYQIYHHYFSPQSFAETYKLYSQKEMLIEENDQTKDEETNTSVEEFLDQDERYTIQQSPRTATIHDTHTNITYKVCFPKQD